MAPSRAFEGEGFHGIGREDPLRPSGTFPTSVGEVSEELGAGGGYHSFQFRVISAVLKPGPG